MLVFDGGMHAGQLQFRPYVPDTVSPQGLHHPLYWMDFAGHAPPLPARTLSLFCYHVGQTDNTQNRDARYFGRGIGLRLLDKTLAWAQAAGFDAVVAKGCPEYAQVIRFMGGMPVSVYRNKGFTVAASYGDEELRGVVEALKISAGAAEAAQISVCVRRFTR